MQYIDRAIRQRRALVDHKIAACKARLRTDMNQLHSHWHDQLQELQDEADYWSKYEESKHDTAKT